MPVQDSEGYEEQRGSIVPGIAGAAIGGAAGAIGVHQHYKNKAGAAEAVTKAQSEARALVQACADEALMPAGVPNPVKDDWERLVEKPMTTTKKHAGTSWLGDPKGLRDDVRLANQREKQLLKLNKKVHTIKGNIASAEGEFVKKHLGADLKTAETQLHNLAAEHITHVHNLTPAIEGAEEVMQAAKGKGSLGKVIAGGAALAAVGGIAAQAMFGQAERPRNSMAERVRAEEAARQQQGAQIG